MLKKIIEMDEKARELKLKAQQDKATSEQEIEQAKQMLYEQYLERARVRAKKNADIEQEHADKKWEENKANYKKAMDSLNTEYTQNCDKWVEQIFQHVINS